PLDRLSLIHGTGFLVHHVRSPSCGDRRADLCVKIPCYFDRSEIDDCAGLSDERLEESRKTAANGVPFNTIVPPGLPLVVARGDSTVARMNETQRPSLVRGEGARNRILLGDD